MKHQHRVLGMLALLSVITYLDRVCIAVAGPRMQDSLHISPQAWGWVTSAFFLSYSAFEIPTGALGDRIGPRRVLTRIVLWWSAFTSLTGAVSSYSLLLLVRFCFGMGEAGAYPNASTVIARWIPPRRRARAWGIVWMTSQIGAAHVAAARRADSGALRLAGVVLSVRLSRASSGPRSGTRGFAIRQPRKAGVTSAELQRDRRGATARPRRHAVGPGASQRRRSGASPPSAPATCTRSPSSSRGCRRIWSGATATARRRWCCRRCPYVVGALRQRHRRAGQRLAGAPIRPEDGPPRARRGRAQRRGDLHDGHDRHHQRDAGRWCSCRSPMPESWRNSPTSARCASTPDAGMPARSSVS